MTQLLSPCQVTYGGDLANLNFDVRMAILRCIRRGGRCWFTVGDSPQVSVQSIRRRGRSIEFVRHGRNEWEELPAGVTLSWAEAARGGGR
jgi:hypothetical protein